ncbi:MAG: DUF3791 domain-containing protein [Thermoguttaceae bacterium]|nr:DUF3791 domain-containing protein [Thermoguttaceae bacterium]
MKANPILLQRKYARVIALFAQKSGLSLDDALDFFYRSEEYKLLREGVADLHCMSDDYLAEDLKEEYERRTS